MSARRAFMKHWWAVEAMPIWAVSAIAVSGAGWYISRLARRPEVVWTRSNPTPWTSISPDETTKMFSGHHKFEKSWSRGKL
ncbi:hypothetical protein BKA62DRAFT_698372 [Auriculariales sp. MPI-PUGE-AT-0066]|nr:hypothetical protein BKA62DRAFT_698372 [Auriculariales sp. MPI-PUGE-AT-0066]